MKRFTSGVFLHAEQLEYQEDGVTPPSIWLVDDVDGGYTCQKIQ